MDWQPMKTAPDDGTEVLVIDKYDVHSLACFQKYHKRQGTWFVSGGGEKRLFAPYSDDAEIIFPVAWMYKPAPLEGEK